MQIKSQTWWSSRLGQDMTVKVYGHAGKPILAFPCQAGSHRDMESFGMIEACQQHIDEGKVRIYSVDCIDHQTWINKEIHPHHRAVRHEAYDAFIAEEMIPFIRGLHEPWAKVLATGSSMGGYQSANFFFRHPDMVDGLIALSGVYQLSEFIGGFVDDNVYFQSPLLYLKNMHDPWYLEQYRQSQIIFCVGQGKWEGPMIEDTKHMQAVLAEKGVPAWFDYWGHDVDHDWPWWRKQWPHFLTQLGL